jgi:hypothetical protein
MMKQPKIYRKRSTVIIKTILRVLGAVILVAVVLFFVLFFYLRRYAVYTDDGVHLDFSKSVSDSAQPGTDDDAGITVGDGGSEG